MLIKTAIIPIQLIRKRNCVKLLQIANLIVEKVFFAQFRLKRKNDEISLIANSATDLPHIY